MKLPSSPLSSEYHQNHSILNHRRGGSYVCSEKQCLWSALATPQRLRSGVVWPSFLLRAARLPPDSPLTTFHHHSSRSVEVCLCPFRRHPLRTGLLLFCFRWKSYPCPRKQIVFSFWPAHQYCVFVALCVKAKKSDCNSADSEFSEKSWKKLEKSERGCGRENITLRSIVDR